MSEPYQAVGLIQTMRGIRRRDEIMWNIEHISHMIKAACWLSSMDLPVRLICIPEGGLQGFTDEVFDSDHVQFRARVRDRHPRPRDRRARQARAPVERVPDRDGEGASPRVRGSVLQRRLRDRAAGRDGDPPPPQGRAAAAGRALRHAAQRLGPVDRVVRREARVVLPGRRHRNRADRDHDGERGVVPGERTRARHERMRDRLPRALPRPRGDERHVRRAESRTRARQQHVRDRR